jgi:hypothetical protein
MFSDYDTLENTLFESKNNLSAAQDYDAADLRILLRHSIFFC